MDNPFRLTGMATVLLFLITVFAASVSADEYVIGPGDALKISFWQDPELDQVVAVRQDGKITLSIIGEIIAAGLTSRELSDKIEKNVSLYHKKISQAAVTVIGFYSQRVFVSGQVNQTGKKTFEVIPDIWTVIKEAGGATEVADLTRVTVIRSDKDGGERITVNLLEAISTGQVDKLPKLKSGDTIEVPRMAGGVPGRRLTADYSQRKGLYYVLGQVRVPGTQAYEDGIDIFDALGAAGGTTEFADLANIKIISKIGSGSGVMKVNLKKYQAEGQARRVLIKPEDTIVIDAKKRPLLSWSQLRDFAAVAGTIISFIYLIDRR
jgi:polysaccharide export outer membrane protein